MYSLNLSCSLLSCLNFWLSSYAALFWCLRSFPSPVLPFPISPSDFCFSLLTFNYLFKMYSLSLSCSLLSCLFLSWLSSYPVLFCSLLFSDFLSSLMFCPRHILFCIDYSVVFLLSSVLFWSLSFLSSSSCCSLMFSTYLNSPCSLCQILSYKYIPLISFRFIIVHYNVLSLSLYFSPFSRCSVVFSSNLFWHPFIFLFLSLMSSLYLYIFLLFPVVLSYSLLISSDIRLFFSSRLALTDRLPTFSFVKIWDQFPDEQIKFIRKKLNLTINLKTISLKTLQSQ